MTKSTLFIASVVILFFVLAGTCWASNAGELCAKRFMIGLQGNPDADLSLDIIAASYDDHEGDMEITLRNWEAMQYKYSEGNLLTSSAQVSLFIGCSTSKAQKMSDARIVSVAPGFHQNEASTIVISARGTKPVQKRIQINVDYGGSLLEFYPVLKDGAIESKGTTTGIPDLRTGTILIVNGVGKRYNGEYSVTRAIHIFDHTKGYTTQFVAQKAAKRVSTFSANEIYARQTRQDR